MKNSENSQIEITSIYLSKNRDRVKFQSYPKRLVYKGRTYVLAEA